MEIWKDIAGYEGLYQVSNLGRVKSLERTVRYGRGYRTIPEKILKTNKKKCDYLKLNLWKEGKAKNHRVHRLVAQSFIHNPDNLPEVNHKDENKENNCVDNLEWCTSKYNCNHGTRNQRGVEKRRNHPKLSKPVLAINKVSGLILQFPSTHEAERKTGIKQQSIVNCCNGKYGFKSAGGYIWMYAE